MLRKVSSLIDFCLYNIIFNLNLNFELLKKYNRRVPTEIGDLIFQKVVDNFDYDLMNLKFFDKSVVSLSKLVINEDLTNNLDEFFNIDTSSLKSLFLDVDDKANVFYMVEMEDHLSQMENIENLSIGGDLESSDVIKKFSNTLKTLGLLYSRENDVYLLIEAILTCPKLERIKLQNSEPKENAHPFINLTDIFQLENLLCLSLSDFTISFGNDKKIINETNFRSKNLNKICIQRCKIDTINLLFFKEILKRLQLESVMFNAFGNIEIICDGLLNSRKNLKSLKISNYTLKTKDIDLLKNFLIQCEKLTVFEFSFCNIDKSGLKEILTGLKVSSKCLRQITLTGCWLNRENCRVMREFLEECTCLEKVDISSSYLQEDGIFDVLYGLDISSNSLTEVKLGMNRKLSDNEVILNSIKKEKENIFFYFYDVTVEYEEGRVYLNDGEDLDNTFCFESYYDNF